jgi:hypothetical protein
MKAIRIGTIAFALLAGIGSASMASPGGSAWITDGLTAAQHQEIWQGISKQVRGENAPGDFKAAVGEAAPNALKLQPMPKDVSDQIPAVKPYDFAMLQNQVLIVNPTSRAIIDIIAH